MSKIPISRIVGNTSRMFLPMNSPLRARQMRSAARLPLHDVEIDDRAGVVAHGDIGDDALDHAVEDRFHEIVLPLGLALPSARPFEQVIRRQSQSADFIAMGHLERGIHLLVFSQARHLPFEFRNGPNHIHLDEQDAQSDEHEAAEDRDDDQPIASLEHVLIDGDWQSDDEMEPGSIHGRKLEPARRIGTRRIPRGREDACHPAQLLRGKHDAIGRWGIPRRGESHPCHARRLGEFRQPFRRIDRTINQPAIRRTGAVGAGHGRGRQEPKPILDDEQCGGRLLFQKPSRLQPCRRGIGLPGIARLHSSDEPLFAHRRREWHPGPRYRPSARSLSAGSRASFPRESQRYRPMPRCPARDGLSHARPDRACGPHARDRRP